MDLGFSTATLHMLVLGSVEEASPLLSAFLSAYQNNSLINTEGSVGKANHGRLFDEDFVPRWMSLPSKRRSPTGAEAIIFQYQYNATPILNDWH